MKFIINHFYIFLSIFFAVSSQLIIKWKMSAFSIENIGSSIWDKFSFAFSMLFNPYIMLSLLFTLLSGLSWMIAMTKFDISYAYPYTALGFVFILFFSYLLFHEPLNLYKIIGTLLIVIGIIVSSRGS